MVPEIRFSVQDFPSMCEAESKLKYWKTEAIQNTQKIRVSAYSSHIPLSNECSVKGEGSFEALLMEMTYCRWNNQRDSMSFPHSLC